MTCTTFYHGSALSDLTAQAVETGPRGSAKQAKKGRAYCGFYVTPDQAYAERYAAAAGKVYAVTLAHGARILTLDTLGQVERISEAQAAAWIAQGFAAVQGLNVIGARLEVAILDASAIIEIIAA